jgi:hypothetical protein
MSDQLKCPDCLTEAQRNRMLTDIHHSLVGDPLDLNKPGLVALVARHNYTLYGKTGKNGLVGDNNRYKSLVWMGGGIMGAFIVLGKVMDWLVAMKTASH